jgi:hypothetical protein
MNTEGSNYYIFFVDDALIVRTWKVLGTVGCPERGSRRNGPGWLAGQAVGLAGNPLETPTERIRWQFRQGTNIVILSSRRC